jgi:hypothetical protein
MTLDEELTGPAKAWALADENKGMKCIGAARRELLQGLRDKQRDKGNAFLSHQLTKIIKKTRGVNNPENTRTSFTKKAVGDPGSNSKVESDKQNSKWNPINNSISRIKKRNDIIMEATEMLMRLGKDGMIYSPEKVKQEVYDILNKKRPELGQKSIADLVDGDEDFSLYFGMTERGVKDEDLAWASPRGGSRPVLLRGDENPHAKRQHFTPPEARKQLGFKSIQLFCSELILNAYQVEEELQTQLHHLPLGVRLWREIAMGQKDAGRLPKDGMAYKVFITYSFEVQAAINDNKCIVIP